MEIIVPKKVEQINDHLFIDTYKSNNINIGLNDMTERTKDGSLIYVWTYVLWTADAIRPAFLYFLGFMAEQEIYAIEYVDYCLLTYVC